MATKGGRNETNSTKNKARRKGSVLFAAASPHRRGDLHSAQVRIGNNKEEHRGTHAKTQAVTPKGPKEKPRDKPAHTKPNHMETPFESQNKQDNHQPYIQISRPYSLVICGNFLLPTGRVLVPFDALLTSNCTINAMWSAIKTCHPSVLLFMMTLPLYLTRMLPIS